MLNEYLKAKNSVVGLNGRSTVITKGRIYKCGGYSETNNKVFIKNNYDVFYSYNAKNFYPPSKYELLIERLRGNIE